MLGKEYQEISAELDGIKKIIEARNQRLKEAGRKLSQLEKLLDRSIIRRDQRNAGQQEGDDPIPIASHIVEMGDTLASISARYYGSADNWRAIYQANEDIIGTYPSVIRIGQVLTIPALQKK